MDNRFFDRPVLNSPYEYPARHGERDAQGRPPTQRIVENRCRTEFITPIPKPKKHKKASTKEQMIYPYGKK